MAVGRLQTRQYKKKSEYWDTRGIEVKEKIRLAAIEQGNGSVGSEMSFNAMATSDVEFPKNMA